MTKLLVRLSLLMVCLAALAGAGFLLWTSNRLAENDRAALRTFQVNARAAAVSLVEMRAAQQSYVAAGQGEDFWFARVTAIKKEIDERLATLRRSASSAEAVADLDAAANALQEFMQMDLRAREYTRGRQLTLASDMVFADGFELTKKAGDAIERAWTAEEVGRDAAFGATTRRQATIVAGAGGVALFVVLLLLPTGRRSGDETAATALAPLPAASEHTLSDLSEFGVAPQPAPVPVPEVSLERVATLCNELARVPETRMLPRLLERTATVIDASGIVIWIADPDGRELTPILIHGYPPQLATRLGNIPRAAENVTASAYRTGLLQTVKSDTISNGAIAVPLVGAGGCVGVMAAEVKNGGEQRQSLLAAASIIAAQLATLVGPPSARAKTEAAS